jgi:hypothetical protein
VNSRTAALSYALVAAELDEYRDEVDRFLTALHEEHYLQLSGQKATLELEPIYERYADLTSLAACSELGELARAAGAGAGLRELWRFACEGHLGHVTAPEQERIAELEATLEADVGGSRVGFRELHAAQANEPDRDRRQALNEARIDLLEQLNLLYRDAFDRLGEAAGELGGGTCRSLYEEFGFPLEPLADECRRFLADTEELHAGSLDRLLRKRLGIRLDEARRWDMPRLFRSDAWDDAYSAERMLPALEGTLADLGIDLRAQRNIELDIEQRPAKDPRAFCSPIDVPARVVLCIKPMGGIDDWRALFHEAGHMEHFAHTSPRLPLEARRLGDDAVTEGWAFLFEHLVSNPAWLARQLDISQPDGLVEESAAVLLFFVRRYCGKLLYELELHAGAELDAMPDRYVELLRDATAIEPSPADFLADVDSGFYVTAYLRAWALQAELSRFLREQHGSSWFASRKAGSLLRELWHEGQGLRADELVDQVSGGTLELAVLTDTLEELVRA